VLRLAGYRALAAPLAEAILAGRLLADAGIAAPDGLAVVARSAKGKIENGRFTGTAEAVAWGRDAVSIAAVLDGTLIRVACADAVEIREGVSPSGQPRDALRFDGAKAESDATKQLAAIGAERDGTNVERGDVRERRGPIRHMTCHAK